MMGSLLISWVCNADLCARFFLIRKLRETMTIQKAQETYEKNKTSHE